MKLITYTCDQELLSLRENWLALQSLSSESNIFIDFDWVYSVWSTLPDGKQLRLITVWDGLSLVGVLPLVILREKIIGGYTTTFLQHLCCKYSDYSVVLLDKNKNPKDLLKLIVKEVFKISSQVGFIKIDNLSSASNTSRIFLKLLRDLDTVSYHYVNVENPVLDLKECSAIDAKQLKDTVRRRKKLLAEYSVEICIGTSVESGAWEKLIEFHRSKYPGRGFNSSCSQMFYKRLIASGFDHRQLEFSYIKLDGEVKAVHFGFRKDKTVYYYVPAFDARLQSSGVGQILMMEIINYYRAEGYLKFDMLRGSEPYKYAWMSDEFQNFSFLGLGALSKLNTVLLYAFSLRKTISRLKNSVK